MYRYQFNVKIVGLPLVAERETCEQTANLCLQLFVEMGIKDIWRKTVLMGKAEKVLSLPKRLEYMRQRN